MRLCALPLDSAARFAHTNFHVKSNATPNKSEAERCVWAIFGDWLRAKLKNGPERAGRALLDK